MKMDDILHFLESSGMCCENCVYYVPPNTPLVNSSGIGICGKDAGYFFAEIGHVEPDFFCNQFSDKNKIRKTEIPKIEPGASLNDL